MQIIVMLVGLAFLAVVALALFGWIALLVIGVVQRSRRGGGTALMIVGAVWGLSALGFMGLALTAYRSMPRQTTFDPASYKGPTGAITLPYKGEARVMLTDRAHRRILVVEADHGVARAPVKTYSEWSCTMTAKGADGIMWTLSCDPVGDSPKPVQVSATAPLRLDVGPPLTVTVKPGDIEDGRAWFDLEVTGRDGGACTLSNSRRTAPQFQVLDSAGKELWTGSFEYG